jgi:hypothetical protein
MVRNIPADEDDFRHLPHGALETARRVEEKHYQFTAIGRSVAQLALEIARS